MSCRGQFGTESVELKGLRAQRLADVESSGADMAMHREVRQLHQNDLAQSKLVLDAGSCAEDVVASSAPAQEKKRKRESTARHHFKNCLICHATDHNQKNCPSKTEAIITAEEERRRV